MSGGMELKRIESWLRHGCAAGALVCSAVALSACSLLPKEIAQVNGPSYAELMASADEAQQKGETANALEHFERATKADPSKKQPWLRMAQAQFDARNYGPAISAAQEVLQRDNADVTANSILAASGLRVSALALEQLRQANAVNVGTRQEAQLLAKTMRDALGESILPAPVAAAPEPAKTKPNSGSPGARKAARPPAAALPAPAAAALGKPPVSESKRNPFDALKG
jgi:tetratricopeptide (TPR) repeat protein